MNQLLDGPAWQGAREGGGIGPGEPNWISAWSVRLCPKLYSMNPVKKSCEHP